MKPTLIKRCGNERNWEDPEGRTVILTFSRIYPCPLHPKYCLVYEDDKYHVMIRQGFISDGMSIPRLVYTLTGLTPFDQRCLFGGFIHDGLYSSHLLLQYEADVILNNILEIEPSPNWAQRQVVYSTLRCVGHIAYNGKTAEEIALARKYVKVVKKRKLKMETVIGCIGRA